MTEAAIGTAVVAALVTFLFELVAHLATMKLRGTDLGRIAAYTLGVALFFAPYAVWVVLHADPWGLVPLGIIIGAAGAGTVLGHEMDKQERAREKSKTRDAVLEALQDELERKDQRIVDLLATLERGEV